jgi:hypothetical protein
MQFKITYSKIINYFAGSAIAVYLITENVFIRNIIWNKLFCCDFSNSVYYTFLHIVFSVFVLYVVCTVVDKLKNILFMNIINKRVSESRCIKKIENNLGL